MKHFALLSLSFLPLVCNAQQPAVTPTPATVLSVCVAKGTGDPRFVNSAANCTANEIFAQWNVMGPAGPQGANGAQGPQGVQGAQGAQGPAGPEGARGPAGQTGSQGPAGQAGQTGQAGSQGPTGPTGPAGPQGPAGPAGTVPAVLTNFATVLAPNPSAEYNAQFIDAAGTGGCTLGDIILSTNRYYGGNAYPADGSLIQISTNTALFSLLGTRFGGDGIHTYGLPNLTAAAPAGLYYSICFLGVFPARF